METFRERIGSGYTMGFMIEYVEMNTFVLSVKVFDDWELLIGLNEPVTKILITFIVIFQMSWDLLKEFVVC